MFERLWNEAFPITTDLEAMIELAPALVDLGLGAASVASWDRASDALQRAAQLADAWAASDVSSRARWALDHVRTHRSPDLAAKATSRRSGDAPAGVLADVLSVLQLGTWAERN
jgi:hypothetical protein